MHSVSGNQMFVDLGSGENFSIYIWSGELFFRAGGIGSQFSVPLAFLPLNSWHLLSMTWQGYNQSFVGYIDGNAVGSAIQSWAGIPPSMMTIGSSTTYGPYPLSASIDEFRVFNYAMTDVQIKSGLTVGMTGNEPGLVSAYAFSEGNGNILTDIGPGQNHATITGGQWEPSALQIAGGSGNNTYAWNTGAISPAIYATQAGTYTVTVTNLNGCSDADSVQLALNSPPSGTISNNGPVCFGTTLQLNASGGTQYQWTGPNGFNSTIDNPTVPNVSAPDMGNYTVKISNGTCSTTLSTNVINLTCGVSLSLDLFLEGFYRNTSNRMFAVADPANSPLQCDTITVGLVRMEESVPFILRKSVIDIYGHSTCGFNVPYGDYKIVIRHRNSLEVWSSVYYTFNSSAVYLDLRSTPALVAGSMLKDFNDGYFGLYSGDVNQDGFINEADLVQIGFSANQFDGGYITPDLNGDGIVESSDYSMVENNYGLFSIHP
jgi:hypothetical protein